MPKRPKETSDEYFATARLGISTSVHRLWRKGHEEWHVVVSRLMEKTARAALAFEELVRDQLVAQRQLWAHTAKKRRSESWAQMRGRKANDNTMEKRRKLSALREEQAVERIKCPATSDLQAEHRLRNVRGAASDGDASD